MNLLLAVGMSIFLAADYRIELRDRLQDKRENLRDQARALTVAIAGLGQHGPKTVQRYLELVSGSMQADDTTPQTQHIVAVIGENVFYSGASQDTASPRLLRAIREAARSNQRTARIDGQTVMVGLGKDRDIAVYVAESLAEVRTAVRGRVIWRLSGFTIIALLGAAAVNLLLLQLVTRPLRRLVGTVRRIAGGELGAHTDRFNTAELMYLATEVDAMSDALAEAERLRQQRMDKARRIQSHLHPRPEEVEQLNVRFVHEPAEQVAGDYLDLAPTESGGVLMCMADVTGHGVPAAMGAAMLKTLFVAARAETRKPAQILRRMNAGFQPISLTEDFATVFIARLDRDRGVLRYASAGHDPAYLLRREGDCIELHSTGLLLGVDPEAGWDTQEFEVEPGDRLVVVTDGLAETMSPGGNLLGRNHLRKIIVAEHAIPLDNFCPAVLHYVEQHRGNVAARDDMTILAMEV